MVRPLHKLENLTLVYNIWMTQYPEKHHRRSIRLDGFDYTQWEAYFITLLTFQRQPLFGRLNNRAMELSELGDLVTKVWYGLVYQFPSIELDEFVVMPDHVHGIIILGEFPVREIDDQTPISGRISKTLSQPQMKKQPPLGRVVGTYKSTVARIHNISHGTIGQRIWHRNYYERIIRDERELGQVQRYIQENPLRFGEENESDYPWGIS